MYIRQTRHTQRVQILRYLIVIKGPRDFHAPSTLRLYIPGYQLIRKLRRHQSELHFRRP